MIERWAKYGNWFTPPIVIPALLIVMIVARATYVASY
jgi:hypothetical protein